MYPKSNLYYNLKTFDISTGGKFILRRPDYLKSLLMSGISVSQEQKVVVSKNIERLFSLLDIRYLIMPWDTTQAHLKKVDQVSYDGHTIFLYEIDGSYDTFSIFYIPTTLQKINNITDFENLLNKHNNFIQNATVENFNKGEKNNNKVNLKVEYIKTENDYVKIRGVAEKNTFIVLKKNWYPEWHA